MSPPLLPPRLGSLGPKDAAEELLLGFRWGNGGHHVGSPSPRGGRGGCPTSPPRGHGPCRAGDAVWGAVGPGGGGLEDGRGVRVWGQSRGGCRERGCPQHWPASRPQILLRVKMPLGRVSSCLRTRTKRRGSGKSYPPKSPREPANLPLHRQLRADAETRPQRPRPAASPSPHPEASPKIGLLPFPVPAATPAQPSSCRSLQVRGC